MLSLDTSSVTDMRGMFYVRPRAPCARSSVGLSPANRSSRHHPTPLSPPLACTSRSLWQCPHLAKPHGISLDSAGSVGVRPGAESRHVRSHNHVRHVLCAPDAPNPRRVFPCKPLEPPSPHAPLPSPCLHLAPCTSYVLVSTRQGALAFNQPLDLDTSSVTDMRGMFLVRPRVPCAQPPVGPCPCTLLAPPSPHAPLPSPCLHLAPPHIAAVSTRQAASAFNQPLGLDTSSVIDMSGMFSVRTRVPCAQCHLELSTAHYT